MKRILGLDLGSSSIGWAVIDYSNDINELEIIALGSRVIPIDGGVLSKFNTGQSIEINSKRTAMRTARKCLDRYQQRRENLRKYLIDCGIPEDCNLIKTDRLTLWRLRAAAAERKVQLTELHRVLMHINQKRGYKASKQDLSDKTNSAYVKDVRDRFKALEETGLTVGQFYYKQLKDNPNYSVKGTDRVLPRVAYVNEVSQILETQAQYYPDKLTPNVIDHIINYIMFYQRPLKSCKHLVSNCEHMRQEVTTSNGDKITVSPKVAQKSNPLFEESRLWQAVNNITLRDRSNAVYPMSSAERQRLYNHLKTKDQLKATDIYSILFNKKKGDPWKVSDSVGKGIPGNRTIQRIKTALNGKYSDLLTFDINIIDCVDTATGEAGKEVDPKVIEQPLYRLWHTLYSISDIESLKNTLRRNFGIDDEEVLENLSSIDFAKDGYGNMSVKGIRKILPYLMEGEVYSKACELAGFRHSDYLTAEENAERQLKKYLTPLKKGELRQPIVEKILNQTVSVVNALIDNYGPFDEIHVELARELKKSKDERNDESSRMSKQKKENDRIAKTLREEYRLEPTRTRITKMKLWEENDHKCLYCDAPVSGREFLEGINYEVEHIIPKSLLFDDSINNKVCACRKCNQEKGNMTAYDYMHSKGERALNEYINRINTLKDKEKITKSKLNKLTTTAVDIPQDFIDRQLRQSQYIARKASEMMSEICRDVLPTGGSVTAFLRHIWGWNNVLHDINYPTYSRNEALVDLENKRILNWDKRADHRHHAIDALVIACTSRSIIQRLNNLSSLKDEDIPTQDKNSNDRRSRIERFALAMPHFTFAQVLEAASRIFISIKPNTKLTTPGKRYKRSGKKSEITQTGLRIPRGPLHEETLYGMIHRYDSKGNLLPYIVTKKKLTDINNEKIAAKIVDGHIRKLVLERLASVKDKTKAFTEQPLYSDAAHTQRVKSVRIFTNSDAYTNQSPDTPIRYDAGGKPITFVKPGVNHHIAIYKDDKGKLQEHVVTFMHAVERYNKNIPAIIKDPAAVWSEILDSKENYSEEFLSHLPKDGWQFVMSMQRNEMFILGMSDDDFHHALENKNYSLLCKHLYRVQNLSSTYYNFSLHTQTIVEKDKINKEDKLFIRISSLKSLENINPIKVRINVLGEICYD